MANLGDTFRVYIKPSLDGVLVIRKRNTRQVSGRVAASKKRVGDAKPSVTAHNACVTAGEARMVRVYVPGTGYQDKNVCPIKVMKRHLRTAMKSAHGVAT